MFFSRSYKKSKSVIPYLFSFIILHSAWFTRESFYTLLCFFYQDLNWILLTVLTNIILCCIQITKTLLKVLVKLIKIYIIQMFLHFTVLICIYVIMCQICEFLLVIYATDNSQLDLTRSHRAYAKPNQWQWLSRK